MKTPIEVRLVGPALLCHAIEALLATVAPIYLDNNAPSTNGASPSHDDGGVGGLRRRSGPGTPPPAVILLVGEGWQQRVAAEARLPGRAAAAAAAGAPPRYALIADGKIDFYGARKMAVNAFIGTDEPVSVLVQGIQAAAQNRLYCSPQLLPALIDAVGTAQPGDLLGGKPGEAGTAPAAGGKSSGDKPASGTASQAALLSAREHEVALHAARGLSNEQIAVFLGISVPTVKFHLMHAFRKLDIQRRTQLYAYMPYLTSATEALLPQTVD